MELITKKLNGIPAERLATLKTKLDDTSVKRMKDVMSKVESVIMVHPSLVKSELDDIKKEMNTNLDGAYDRTIELAKRLNNLGGGEIKIDVSAIEGATRSLADLSNHMVEIQKAVKGGVKSLMDDIERLGSSDLVKQVAGSSFAISSVTRDPNADAKTVEDTKNKELTKILAVLYSILTELDKGNEEIQKLAEVTVNGASNQNDARVGMIKSLINKKAGVTKDDTDEEKEQKLTALAISKGTQGLKKGINLTKDLMSKSFNILEDLYNKVKQASPLLEAIESMFNLAVQLILMPLGNALGERMIPAITELLKNVTGLWKDFAEAVGSDGKLDLSKIVDIAMTKGLDKVGEFFNAIGNVLKSESNPMLRSIGTVLTTLGNFTESNLSTFMDSVIRLASWTVRNFDKLIMLISGLWGAYMAIKIVELELLAQPTWLKDMGGGLALLTLALAGAGIGAGVGAITTSTIGLSTESSNLKNESEHNATGGYVPPTAGGSLHLIGEGNEGEYIIPESRMGETGTTNVFNFYGFTSDEVVSKVREVLSGELSASRYRGAL